jgi:hypothetical protein
MLFLGSHISCHDSLKWRTSSCFGSVTTINCSNLTTPIPGLVTIVTQFAVAVVVGAFSFGFVLILVGMSGVVGWFGISPLLSHKARKLADTRLDITSQ